MGTSHFSIYRHDGMDVVCQTICPMCHSAKSFRLKFKDVRRWRDEKELIQKVWPEMCAEDRERLISGMCPSCYGSFAE